MKKNLFKILARQGESTLTRFLLWGKYGLGCYRSISSQLRVIENYSVEDLVREVEEIEKICNLTGLDTDYLTKIVRVRLSAAILRLLELCGADKKSMIITSNSESLKEMIEFWGNVKINVNEDLSGYKYHGRSGYFWSTECDIENRKRFQLFTIIMMIQGKKEK